MEYLTLWKANARKHKGSLVGVFLLLLLVCLALGSVLTVWNNSGSYIRFEMKRAGFGDLTAWVHDVPELAELEDEIASGEIYVSPSMVSMFGLHPGDEISFAIARSGQNVSFVVKGFYEDPFMKTLLWEGAMLYIFSVGDGETTVSDLNRMMNENTDCA